MKIIIYNSLTLSTLGMTSHTHQNWQYQSVGRFGVYLHAKIYPSPVSWNIANIMQTYYFGYFGHDSDNQQKQ